MNESLPALVHDSLVPMNDALTLEERARIDRYASRFRAEATYRNWEKWWRVIACWCAAHDLQLLPMSWETAAAVVSAMADAGYAWGTICNARSVIAVAHQYTDNPDPTQHRHFRRVMAGIANTIGTDPNRKDALLIEDLRAIYEELSATPTFGGLQEWAILLLGFFGAFRRSEIVALDVADVEFRRDGSVRLRICKSKAEQTRSRYVVVDPFDDPRFCPVATLRAWYGVVSAQPGPLFRKVNHLGALSSKRMSDRTVARVVKRHCERIGLDPERFGAHSLRAGFITDGLASNVSEIELAYQARQSDLKTLLAYNRPRGRRRNLTEALLASA